MRIRPTFLAAPLRALSTALGAQTVVVTGSNTTFTNAGPANANDPACAASLDTWCARNVRNGGSVGITSTYPNNSTGSIEFNGPANAKADFEYHFSPANTFKLGDLFSLGYDWFRSSTSTASSHFAPALRLALRLALTDANGAWKGYLVYEPALNGAVMNQTFAQPTNAWQSTNITGTGGFWWTVEGSQLAYSLDTWQAGRTTANGTLDGNFNVIGFSAGIGSGWDGSFSGAVDNVRYQTTAMRVPTNFNFEVAAVPEPSTYVLMASGLLALGVAARRRRNA